MTAISSIERDRQRGAWEAIFNFFASNTKKQ